MKRVISAILRENAQLIGPLPRVITNFLLLRLRRGGGGGRCLVYIVYEYSTQSRRVAVTVVVRRPMMAVVYKGKIKVPAVTSATCPLGHAVCVAKRGEGERLV